MRFPIKRVEARPSGEIVVYDIRGRVTSIEALDYLFPSQGERSAEDEEAPGETFINRLGGSGAQLFHYENAVPGSRRCSGYGYTDAAEAIALFRQRLR